MYTVDMFNKELDFKYGDDIWTVTDEYTKIPNGVDVYAYIASRVFGIDYAYFKDTYDKQIGVDEVPFKLFDSMRAYIKQTIWEYMYSNDEYNNKEMNNLRLKVLDELEKLK